MGDAKRKARLRKERLKFSKPLSAARFGLYALGTRHSAARLLAEELSYWADHDEKVLGMVVRDVTDNDYAWMLLARDRAGRFRCVKVDASLTSEEVATEFCREEIAKALEEGELGALGDQGDEPNAPFDVLRVPPGEDPDKLHPYFKSLIETPGREPARRVMREIGPWLAPTDPHFVNEFQFKQFDQRLWELYLWAAFRELGFDIKQPEAPDFTCSAPGMQFTVEATTVGPSKDGVLAAHPDPKTPEEMREFLANYMPMKFGSTLTNKLNKKNKFGESYWERGEAAGKPFILAVADFHKGSMTEIGSMTYTHSALSPYLYGHRVDWEMIDGRLVVRAVRNPEHRHGGKVIPSGFFDLPGAENISAVLFSNAGTLAKFDRMGVAAGFAPPDHRYVRLGTRFDPDPNAVVGVPFYEEVKEGHDEFWSDELQLFHNPNAKHKIAHEMFSGITQHFFEDGNHYAITPPGSVLASFTWIIRIVAGEEEKTAV